MARLPKIGVDYFPHVVGSRNEETLSILKSEFGCEGYGFWYQLLEILGAQKGLSYDCSHVKKWLWLTSSIGVEKERAEEILNLVAELEAIDTDLWREDKVIWCQEFADQLDTVYRKRRQSIPQKPRLKREVALEEELQKLRATAMAEETERAIAQKEEERVAVATSTADVASATPASIPKEETIPKERSGVAGEVSATTTSPVRQRKTLEERNSQLMEKYPYISEALIGIMGDWLDYKDAKGQSYRTETSIKTCYEELVKASSGNPQIARQIINFSIGNNYNGFFPLKDRSIVKSSGGMPNCLTNGSATFTNTAMNTI